MNCNVGSTDRMIRIIIGAITFVVLFSLGSWWFLLGTIPIFTGLIELCPIYSILGINTCKEKKKFWA
jgi:hypothetical protein